MLVCVDKLAVLRVAWYSDWQDLFFFFISSTQQNQSCVLLIRDLEQSYYVESRVKLHASFDKDMIYLSQHKTQNVCITYKKIHIFIAILCVNFLRCSSMLPPQDGPIALFIRNTVTEQNFFNPAGHSQAIVLLIKIQIFVRIFIPGRDRSLKEMLLQIILSMIYFNLKHLNRLAWYLWCQISKYHKVKKSIIVWVKVWNWKQESHKQNSQCGNLRK